jgi:hypothetical protein
MGTTMKCYLSGDNLVVQFESVGTSETIDNKIVRYIQNQTISVPVGRGVKPVDALNELKFKLLNVLNFDGESFDDAVTSTMRNLSMENIDSDKIRSRKYYARYFYTLFMNRTKTDLENNKANDSAKLGLILIELISWWFIRRAVHVFVVSAILERVGVKDNAVKPSMNFQVGLPISASTGNVSAKDCKVEVELITKQFNEELAKLKNEKSLSNSSSVVIAKQFSEIETKYNDLENIVKLRNDRVIELETQLDNYKQLLLESTSMIFKLDEIPNIIQTNAK